LLEHRLPVLMGGLLVLAILAISAAAYFEVRQSAMGTATQRLSSIALQLRDNFQQSGTQLRSDVRAAAAAPALAAYVTSLASAPSTEASRTAALGAMNATGPSASQTIGTELRDRSGRVLLSNIPSGFAFDTMSLSNARRSAIEDSASVGRFRTVASMPDTLVFPVVAPIAGTDAFIVRWRRLAGSRRQRELISHLIGSHASLFLGNLDGRVGTDLEKTDTRPPIQVDTPGATRVYQRDPDRADYLAASALVPGTPWVVIIDMPMARIAAPINQFLRRIGLIAAVAILLSVAAAHFTSRRMNDTLDQLHDAQEALVRRERLALLGQLSSGVGHELRNPLGVMTNAVYYLKAVLGSAPAKVHEYLDILQQQITLSEKIVGDLLDFARQKPPQRTATALRDATQSQVDKLPSGDAVAVDIQIPESVPRVLVDPVQLGQVVFNLLTNASQAMNGTGRITVRARENGSRVYYEVADTGPGIPPQNSEKIFEPLFTTKARGIGLGLSVSRMLARANGGDLTATSVPGQGATFTLTLEKAGATA
jgi:signal transduction histidine kinase